MTPEEERKRRDRTPVMTPRAFSLFFQDTYCPYLINRWGGLVQFKNRGYAPLGSDAYWAEGKCFAAEIPDSLWSLLGPVSPWKGGDTVYLYSGALSNPGEMVRYLPILRALAEAVTTHEEVELAMHPFRKTPGWVMPVMEQLRALAMLLPPNHRGIKMEEIPFHETI